MIYPLYLFAVLAPIAQADCNWLGLWCPGNPTGATFADYLTVFVGPLMTLAGTITIIFLVYGGVKYISSQGNEEQAQRAKLTIGYAIIGIIVIALAGILINAFLNA